jgi:hypothetical protein
MSSENDKLETFKVHYARGKVILVLCLIVFSYRWL